MRDPGRDLSAEARRGWEELTALALDLRWTFDHAEDALWERIEPELWGLTHNAWAVLQTASLTRLHEICTDRELRARATAMIAARRRYLARDTWFARTHPDSPLTAVAYFSLEFMLSEALPIYAGGLGNVAGDQLKAASDLGVPVVGVGLLYQQGYFRQVLEPDGTQRALYPYNDPGQLPVTPVRDASGRWVRLAIPMPGYTVWLRAWQATVGRVRLLLLDSNDPANPPMIRGITSELYGGGPELRLQQEMVLGIAGWRLLDALGIRPEVCHLNEGHAALVVLERARSFMAETGHPFDVALTVTRAGNVFTTHTPVDAGFDRFAPDLVARLLGHYAKKELGLDLTELLALGRARPDDPSEPFNMAYLAARGSGAVNAVSALHARTSRPIFQPIFPRWPEAEVPVVHVTNGVHVPSWDSAPAARLWETACGACPWDGAAVDAAAAIRRLPDEALWRMRTENRRALVRYVRERVARELAAAGAYDGDIAQAREAFDPEALTLGFARRFATYKRPTLLLHDEDRLVRLLTSRERPVQLIVAGKAHPHDREGQALVQAWVRFIRERPEVRSRVAFVGDYDMVLARHLVQGVDVWITTPRRPYEASGTSGMKVLANGGLNLSTLDGWWAEAYAPDLGFALDGADGPDDGPSRDAAEAAALYDRLERDVVPCFYDRDVRGIPVAWLARVRESMARLTLRFSADRTVREYTERHYLPAAAAYRRRASDDAALGRRLTDWRRHLARDFRALRFGAVSVDTAGGHHAFRVELFTGSLDPDAIRVELYADPLDGGPPVRETLVRGARLPGPEPGYVYAARIPATRPAWHYTARAVPAHPDAAIPLEANQILWQR
ncbi:MAG TPA: alpha-glucan family phosphorylase [Thermodesulfobacteriota bacterium]